MNLRLVRKITTTTNNDTAYQQFKYFGAVSHVRGLGFLGFMGVARTNTFDDSVASLWSLSRHDPQKRGAITHSWTEKDNPFIQNGTGFSVPNDNFVQKTTFQYQTVLKDNKLFINSLDNTKTEDALNGFTTYKSFLYDAHYNPKTVLTEYDSGSSKQTITYSNNTEAGNSYHIGRITEEKNTTTWGDRSHTTTTQYQDFKKHLATTIKTQGDNTQWLTETLKFDAFGNLTKKTLSADTLEEREQSYTYSEDGRFLTSSTDVAGLTTTFDYYDIGTLKSETDPYSNTTSYTYDAWQRPSTVTDYLGNVDSISHSWWGNNVISKTTGADGSQSKEITDVWGRAIVKGSLGINKQWRWVEIEYDITGKVVKQSEPFFFSKFLCYKEYQNILGAKMPGRWLMGGISWRLE